ncbi:MAG TPA: PilZ domain-containing protein [Desulfurobacteriaceae bacterium]|nr:PilZ domain-containing protein [Desulfurobacteriaceae bacterium]
MPTREDIVQYVKWGAPGASELLLALLAIFIPFALVIGYFYVKERLREIKRKELFFSYAQKKGLTKEEVEIIWKYSQILGLDPYLVIDYKIPFEKVMDYYLEHDPNADPELVTRLRNKLGLTTLPPYVPLSTTKDIELYQTGELYFDDISDTISVGLIDKDEFYMYWATDTKHPRLKPGEKVNIKFLRKKDGYYYLKNLEIKDVINEGFRLVLKIPHTRKFERVQFREYIRVEVELNCKISEPVKEDEKGNLPSPEKVRWYSTKTKDISGGGVLVCFPISREDVPKYNVGDKVYLEIDLEGNTILAIGEIRRILEKKNSICYGIQFIDISEEHRKKIISFVNDYIRKISGILPSEIE